MRGCFVLLLLIICSTTHGQQNPAEKLSLKGFKRLYKLNDSVYRSEQPSTKDFMALEDLGVNTILNFRRNKKDDRKARKTNLALLHFPLKT